MFCPSCATENDYGVKYCRSCGRDLQLVAEALTHRVKLSSVFAGRLDDLFRGRLLREERESMREGGQQIALGGMLAMMGALYLSGLSGVWLVGFVFLVALLLILSGAGNVWLSRRQRLGGDEPEIDRLPDDLSIFKPALPPAAARRAPLRPSHPAAGETRPDLLTEAPPSVSEQTTTRLRAPQPASAPRPNEGE